MVPQKLWRCCFSCEEAQREACSVEALSISELQSGGLRAASRKPVAYNSAPPRSCRPHCRLVARGEHPTKRERKAAPSQLSRFLSYHITRLSSSKHGRVSTD